MWFRYENIMKVITMLYKIYQCCSIARVEAKCSLIKAHLGQVVNDI